MRSSAAALPLPDYDRLTIEELAVRIQCLISHELHQLLGYEWVHEQRDDFMELLASRLKALASGVVPTGTPVVFIPEQARSPENESRGVSGPSPEAGTAGSRSAL